MGKFGFAKFIFTNKTTRIFDGVLVRFYEQIISGMWALSVLVPFEKYLERVFLHKHHTEFDNLIYFWFFALSSVIFTVSSIWIPRINQRHLRVEIQQLLRKHTINISQKNEILWILKDTLACRDFFSKEGFWQFAMSNIFNFAIISFYFSIESFISVISKTGSHILISFIFLVIFSVLMVTEWIFDIFLTKKFMTPQNHILNNLEDQKKQLIIRIMRIVGRDSYRSLISQIILEDTIDDIMAILTVTEKNERIQMPQ